MEPHSTRCSFWGRHFAWHQNSRHLRGASRHSQESKHRRVVARIGLVFGVTCNMLRLRSFDIVVKKKKKKKKKKSYDLSTSIIIFDDLGIII